MRAVTGEIRRNIGEMGKRREAEMNKGQIFSSML